MKTGPTETLRRQWTMLRAIPRHPQAVTVTELATQLRATGFTVHRRTVDRDLHDLLPHFPLQVDTRSRPHGWSWIKDAVFDFMPRLTASQGVAIKLAQAHVRHMLPVAMQRELAPLFAAADRELAHTGWKHWHRRTAYAQPMLILLPPKIEPKVLHDIQHAIALGVQLSGRYRSKTAAEATPRLLHPLGLLVRGPVQYLVGTQGDDPKVRQFVVHRFAATRMLDEPRSEPPGFDFPTYATGALAIASRGPIRVHLRFHDGAGEHLSETPLSDDQTWTKDPVTGIVEVQGTREDDEQLKWWIFGFAGKVEVLGPAHLREEIAAELRRAVGRYGVG